MNEGTNIYSGKGGETRQKRYLVTTKKAAQQSHWKEQRREGTKLQPRQDHPDTESTPARRYNREGHDFKSRR